MSFWIFIIVVVAIATCGDVMAKWAQAAGRRREVPAAPKSEELGELRERVELLSDEVNRLDEEQRFLTRLLEERPALPDSQSGVAGSENS